MGVPVRDRRSAAGFRARQRRGFLARRGCLSLHPHNPAKHLGEALSYILGHDGIWATTADDIAEYYLANYYDQVKSWIAERKAQTAR